MLYARMPIRIPQIMHDAAGHADANHAEQLRAIQQVHDEDAENAAAKGIEHAEHTAEQKPGNHNAHAVDGEGIAEAQAVKGDQDHQIRKTELDAGNRYGNRHEYLHV